MADQSPEFAQPNAEGMSAGSAPDMGKPGFQEPKESGPKPNTTNMGAPGSDGKAGPSFMR